jgi:hypothetical protein
MRMRIFIYILFLKDLLFIAPINPLGWISTRVDLGGSGQFSVGK